MDYQTLIRQRISCRSYAARPIEPEKAASLVSFIDSINLEAAKTGQGIRFLLVDRQAGSTGAPQKLGTYGMISGAEYFIAGIVARTETRIWQFGSWFEKIVLFATGQGLATCWLGGSFSRTDFKRKIDLAESEFIPIISPVGYARERRSVMDNLIRLAARSSTRKPWAELFFQGSEQLPLERSEAGPWAIPLEMVQLGPSASNKQPWRVIRDEQGFSFYLARTRGYVSLGFDMQMNDIGIAMCHFELTARELGLPGEWQQLNRPEQASMEYVMTWTT